MEMFYEKYETLHIFHLSSIDAADTDTVISYINFHTICYCGS